MTLIINFLGSIGLVVMGIVIVSLAAAAAAFAGHILGGVGYVRLFRADEGLGTLRGFQWGGAGGALLALYNICTSGLLSAIMPGIGLAVVMLIVTCVIALAIDDWRYQCDEYAEFR